MRPFAPPILVGLDSELLRARGLIGETDQVVSIEPSDTGLLVETDSKTMQLTMSDLDAAGNSWVTKRGTQDDPYLMGGAAPWGGEPVWTELPTPLCGPFEPVGTQRGHYIINDCEEQTAFAVTEEVWQRTNMPPEAELGGHLGLQVASAGELGLIAGGQLEGVTNPGFWTSDNLGQTWQSAERTIGEDPW